MNICIISNYSKTYLFEAVSKELEQQGIHVYWIVCNKTLHHHLQETTDDSRILYIGRQHIEQKETPIDEFKLNELIYGDRVLRLTPEDGLSFLTNIQKPIYDFLKDNNIRNVFGEITWAHEVLIHRMCKKRVELNCTFLNPHVVRIPNSNFAFFTDENQSQFLERDREENFDWEKLIPKAPAYLKINNAILKKSNSVMARLDRIKKFITDENMDINDPTLTKDAADRIRKSVQQEWRKESYKKVLCSGYEDCSDKPYVFLGLHKQPEASIDVLGRYYEDQLQNIKNLWRALPTGWNLIIKEHSVAIGDRPLEFYREIQALPNTFLIHEKTPSYSVIKNAALVATVSGTIAYEAGLMGVPAITFAPTFFNRMNRCNQARLTDLQEFNLKEISESLKTKKDNTESFSVYVHKHTHVGNVMDPITDPNVLNEKNIKNITSAIMEAILVCV
ncbi:MAG: hypothetical protein AB8F74_09465 [Saprospiraceae bacterium]